MVTEDGDAQGVNSYEEAIVCSPAAGTLGSSAPGLVRRCYTGLGGDWARGVAEVADDHVLVPTLHAHFFNVTNWWAVIWRTMIILQCQKDSYNIRSVVGVPLVFSGTRTMWFPLQWREGVVGIAIPIPATAT